jgi:outer membrane lipoprotein-sorting protein
MKDTAAFKLKVDQMSKNTSSLESDFVQVKNLKVLSEKVTSTGHFNFQKKNNLRWEYNEPYKYIIVISNGRILIKDEKNKVKKYDINSNKVFREINDIMVSCVNGEILSSGKFQVSYYENEKNFKIELSPLSKQVKESLKKIHLYFDKNVTSVSKLEMIEPGDDVTTIEFKNKKINEPVPADRFLLK